MVEGEKVHLYAVVYFFLIHLITFEHNKGDFSTPRFALRQTLYNIVYSLFVIFYNFFVFSKKNKNKRFLCFIRCSGSAYSLGRHIILCAHSDFPARSREMHLGLKNSSGSLFPREGGYFFCYYIRHILR